MARRMGGRREETRKNQNVCDKRTQQRPTAIDTGIPF